MADELHGRYVKAGGAYQRHTDTCPACRNDQSCRPGSALYAAFAQLQDAYLKRLKDRARGDSD
ncbi:hypothetical protein [Streptomyces sp. NPDC093109]|uniref:hypothetical protein n=1 Tax=Streptomyces sp. NPDC093109 TaxID=3154977 RepID=UPI00345030D7